MAFLPNRETNHHRAVGEQGVNIETIRYTGASASCRSRHAAPLDVAGDSVAITTDVELASMSIDKWPSSAQALTPLRSMIDPRNGGSNAWPGGPEALFGA
jgi:hypothetical protein